MIYPSLPGGVLSENRPAPESEFRLSVTASLFSGELQYVVASPSRTDSGDALFHFKGMIDGSDRITITRDGALWEHVNWDWPAGPVVVNGRQWNPRDLNYLTAAGSTKFLPDSLSLEDVNLQVLAGRDVLTLERRADALIVFLDDTPLGPAAYEFEIRFHPGPKTGPVGTLTKARLEIAGTIDGSDRVKVTAAGASWEHITYGFPSKVSLNGVAWNVEKDPVLTNEGVHAFLPAGIDFRSARISARKGRDLATMWAQQDAIWIHFADNPVGWDDYELEIVFGQ